MSESDRVVERAAYRQAREDYDLAVRNFQRMAPTMTSARREAVHGELLRRRAELVQLHARMTAKVVPVAGQRGRPRKYATPEEAQRARHRTPGRTAARAEAAKAAGREPGKGGRPRKYATPEEAAEAQREQKRESFRRLHGVKNPRGENINRRKQ